MKYSLCLPLVCLLGQQTTALPTTSDWEDSSLTPLVPIAALASSESSLLDLPHIPLGAREASWEDTSITPVVPVAALGSSKSSLLDLPHVPLGARDARKAILEARALANGDALDLDIAVPLDAYKKASTLASGIPAGHPMTPELLDLIKQQGINSKASKAKRGTFDAATQLVDVTGEHAFIAPNYEQGDKRGPCPGMNSLANHGYISRDGIATVAESITAVNNVYGMGLDIGTFLTVYSLVLAGNPLSLNPSYSIGNFSADVENILDNAAGILGTPEGLDATHNTFEVDGSNTRGDAYDPNHNGIDVNMDLFKALYNLQLNATDPNYSFDLIIKYSLDRFDEVIAFNPYFYYGPFSGLVLRSGANFFAGRLMVNCSAEHPEGILNKENLKAHFGVSGPEEDMVYNRGHERLPDNWYRIPADYDLAALAVDLAYMATLNPRILGIGGNVNGTNTYAGINPSDIVGSGLTSAELLEGNNLLCFAFQTLKLGSPNSLSSLYATVAPVLELLTKVVDTSMLSLGCAEYGELTYGGTDLFSYLQKTYPGAAKSGNAL